VCQGLEAFGIELDPARNAEARGEMTLHGEQSRVQVWVLPTNEELVVARQTYEILKG
jgi:acetate kinase